MKKFLSLQKAIDFLLPILLLLPLFFLNNRESVHWGDDFTVYLKQAANIFEGKHFFETSYYFVSGFSSLVPVAPVGFSLVLVPLYYCFGFNLSIFILFMSLLLVGWAMLGYHFFRRHFGIATSSLMLVFAFYPNFMFWLKLLITSDLLFCIEFLIVLYLLENTTNKGWKYFFITGIFIGLTVVTRNVGWTILLGILCYASYCFAINFLKKNAPRTNHFSNKQILVLSLVAITVVYIINTILFPPPLDYLSDAFREFSLTGFLHVLKSNTQHYAGNFMSLYQSTDKNLQSLSTSFSIFVIVVTLFGFIVKFYNEVSISDFICITYLFFILCFPVIADYRYIVSVHVLLVWYFFYGLKFLFEKLSSIFFRITQVAIFVLLLVLFKDHLQYLCVHGKETLPGPYEAGAQETFTYIRNNISDTALIVFNKPRALAFYSGKKTTIHNWDKNAVENCLRLQQLNAKYYLFNSGIQDESYNELIAYKKPNLKPIYENGQFILYEDASPL